MFVPNNPYNSTIIIVTILFPRLFLVLHYIYFRNLLFNSKQQKKITGPNTHFRRNDDLPLWRGPSVKKKPPFSNARANDV